MVDDDEKNYFAKRIPFDDYLEPFPKKLSKE